MSLLDNIMSANKLGIPSDGFLSGIFQSVKASDDNSFRNFFMDKNKVLCYRRAEDIMAGQESACWLTAARPSCVLHPVTAS